MNQSLLSFARSTMLVTLLALCACSHQDSHDVILRGGTVYDGSGGEPYVADVAIEDDVIVAIVDP